jgi:shikimate kinase
MNLILIGYRGTGKSVVGRIVAQRLKMDYVGMDSRIVERAGVSIPEIVEHHGWPGFRDMESELAAELARQDNLVIDTGGGVIERSENITALKASGRIVWLTASVETIVARIQDDTQRPALVEGKTFTEEVAEVLEARALKYQNASQYQIATDELTPEQVADEVIEVWRASVPGGLRPFDKLR